MSEQLSRFLSYVLRHNPAGHSLTLATEGWANLDDLTAAAQHAGHGITAHDIVALTRPSATGKTRFQLSDDSTRIRATHGHTIPIVLPDRPAIPPATLLHGTPAANADAIMRDGLLPMRRAHVHLTETAQDARQVAERQADDIVIFAVDTAAMRTAGHLFYNTSDGVWLADAVPPHFINAMHGTDAP